VDVRLKYQPLADDPVKLAEGLRLSAGIQAELWGHAAAASRESPTAMVATFINALNETIDTEAERLAASRNRVPGSVWLLLLVVASIGSFTSGYGAGAQGARSAFSSLVLPVLIAVVITLIADVASPRRGFIGVSQQPLIDLQHSIQSTRASGSTR
jgi:hypothetical protein